MTGKMILLALLAALMSTAFACDGNDGDDDDQTSDDDVSQDDDVDDDDASDDDADDDDIDDDIDDDTTVDDDAGEADWKFIRDDQGRALILRGCNFDGSAKGASGLPDRTQDEAISLREVWGFNFMRYLIFWARVEPEMGAYDEAYLDDVEEWLDILADNGMTVVLDMHQDVWGAFAGDPNRGEDSDGAPEWATITDGMPFVDFAGMLGGWAFNYLSPDVMRAFDNFWAYNRHPELQDGYAAMWAHVAARFKDHPAILGYDLMNEPWQGSGLFRPAEFDRTLYSDFLQRMIDAIRAEDPDGWIFYEPNAFVTNQGFRNWLRVLDDPRDGENRLVYYPHLYPVLIDLAGGYYPESDDALERWERLRREDMEGQKAPMLCGEWAMLRYLDRENLDLWTNEALAMFDRVSSGWSYWDCGAFFRAPDDDYRAMIASVYPRAVAGTPTNYHYDPATREFTLEFDNDPRATGPTEIYIPEDREYPEGWALSVSDPEGTWESEWDEDEQVLSVWTDPDQTTHTIQIRPVELH